MEAQAKGTVTPLASMFPEEEARKAAKRVEEKIEEKRNEMNRLDQFVDDNSNLINLVKKLPDQLYHDVMVPFGKLAFFPGRLIHTNEFLVLLGENYYSEKTSKQAVDVLRRREKTLKSQLNSLKAEIEDLQTEASFFTRTASEAAEGLVEIREEYVEENSPGTLPRSRKEESSSHPGSQDAEDDEFERIIARLDELEMEELKGENEDDRDEEEDYNTESVEYSENERLEKLGGEIDHERAEYEEPDAQCAGQSDGHSIWNGEPKYSERLRNTVIEESGEKHQWQEDMDERLNCAGLTSQYLPKESTHGGGTHPQNLGTSMLAHAVSKGKAEASRVESIGEKPKSEFDSFKAFTGSIVEHGNDLETKKQSQVKQIGSQPSKPVSRFKAQRR